jgi:hypothetical protein
MARRIAEPKPRWKPEVQPLAWVTVSTGKPAASSVKTWSPQLPITVGNATVMARTVLVPVEPDERGSPSSLRFCQSPPLS